VVQFEWTTEALPTRAGAFHEPGYLAVEKDGNKNDYTPAVPCTKGLRSKIDRFFEEVIGPEVETRFEFVKKAVDRILEPNLRRSR
jgi:hypothetical protein